MDYDENYERLGRCVVCCVSFGDLAGSPEYCEVHVQLYDPSMPPIPLHEWWPEGEDGYHYDQFDTTG